ncbi:hypothetical protein [Microbacterium sp. E-13]|uniref:hypothetical protein n=1 Tax=Microbacterium sp. E-13 TaxID=3404048 RepID=UPI003CF54927
MRVHRARIAAIGAAIGLAMAVALAAPATAAKPGGEQAALAATYTCATFEGLVLTQPTVSYNGVSLKAGEKITARMSPAATGDEIILTVAEGFAIKVLTAPATQGFVYTAPAAQTVNLSWSLEAAGTRPSSITWTFDCSSASGGTGTTAPVADADRDGVADSSDACASTVLPDAITKKVAGRYYANASKQFVDGTGRSAGLTVADAGGCSALQIAKKIGLSTRDSKSGITLTQLQNWAATH